MKIGSKTAILNPKIGVAENKYSLTLNINIVER
jgi:hypothetical protein